LYLNLNAAEAARALADAEALKIKNDALIAQTALQGITAPSLPGLPIHEC
jgi:hypothetical protein